MKTLQYIGTDSRMFPCGIDAKPGQDPITVSDEIAAILLADKRLWKEEVKSEPETVSQEEDESNG